MSLDLKLLVFYADGERDASLVQADTMLEVLPDERLAQALFALEKSVGRAVHGRFMSYLARNGGEVHYGNTQTTPYGEPLLWVPAKALADAVAALPADGLALNRAAWAYLRMLPPVYGVALYWH